MLAVQCVSAVSTTCNMYVNVMTLLTTKFLPDETKVAMRSSLSISKPISIKLPRIVGENVESPVE